MKYSIWMLIVFSVSCNVSNSRLIEEYYDNGNLKVRYSKLDNKKDGILKSFYENGNLKEVHKFKADKYIDTSFYYYNTQNEILAKEIVHQKSSEGNIQVRSFYKNGKLKEKGIKDKKRRKKGEWFFYDKTGKIKFKDEYFVIKDREFLNQTISYNSNKKVNYSRSKIADFELYSDTIKINEPLQMIACIRIGHLIGNNIKAKIYLSKGYNNKINDDFSNLNQIEIDTVKNLEDDKLNKDTFYDYDQEKCVVFGKWYNKLGDNKIRAVLVEYYKDSNQYKENRFYFEKDIFVIDSLPPDGARMLR